MSQTIENVACTQCGCVCDDLAITIDAGRIIRAERACELAEPWYLQQELQRPPVAAIQGRSAPLEAALVRAAEILAASRAPLIYGLSRSSTEGQRAAVALADRLGATIDTTASLCHAPSIMAFQQAGESTSSLGEIRNRSDLVLFWGCDPLVSHPRHLERYSADPVGEFLPGGRRDRTLVVIDDHPTASSDIADVFIRLEPDRDFEAIWKLRLLIRDEYPVGGANTGDDDEMLVDLARRMKACLSGVAFFGLGLSQRGLGHRNVEALLLLVRDLNRYTRFYARRMRIYGDVTGADSVLCWQTGYPFSVNLGRGFPRFNPEEYSAQGVLEREEADACVIVGSETLGRFSPKALLHLRNIPTIVLDYPTVESIVSPTVKFTTAIYGIHRPGTAYRMDEIPIPLRAFLPSDYPSDDEVLNSLMELLN
ncbi:MAG TPA: formylmethanofuran dehydrogenase subunit B [Planctomycetaceae bacterium]|nr:formylmethanofuran dehydrogenase subunit B [Planctomycetaceae bacterium]